MELVAQPAQILSLFAFFFRIDARFLKFMIFDGALHSVDNEIESFLQLRELFGRSQVLFLFVFRRLVACVNSELGCSVSDALTLDGPDAALRFPLGEPLVETGDRERSVPRTRKLRFVGLLPYRVNSEA